jgi:hypothetical protein
MAPGARIVPALAFLATLVAFTVLMDGARAQTGPVIVVPGKPGVPVMIYGVDATGAVVYGDWGLAKPNNMGLLIEGARPAPYPSRFWPGAYFPGTGQPPPYGRKEIEPPPGRLLPPLAPQYQRSWTVSPEPGPVTEYPPFETPPVIVEPRLRRGPGDQRGPRP